MSRKPHFLFVNPWIHDFAAYDLFYRPLGLLHLAETMAKGPADITIIDLPDRFNPLWAEDFPHHRDTDAGTGHFYREIIEKPAVVGHIPRYFSRYGAPRAKVVQILRSMKPKPDAIFLTSHMTYWYSGVRETMEVLRGLFPGVPVILGGIYASLLPDHVRKVIQPDLLIQDNNFPILQKWLKEHCNYSELHPLIYRLRKVWDYYPVLKHYPLLTSVGCPYRCAFCAGPRLNPAFLQFSPESILDDIAYARTEQGLSHFVFYDDALFANRETHIKPLLKKILQRWSTLTFHSPNGLFARFIDEELAEMMAATRFEEPRLSLETVVPEHRNLISNKVNRKTYLEAVRHLQSAGYGPRDLVTYVIMRLPGQTPREVEDTAQVALDAGSRVSLSAYSPVPGTPLWEKSGLCDTDDPLLQNNTVYWYRTDHLSEWETLRLRVNEQNIQLKG